MSVCQIPLTERRGAFLRGKNKKSLRKLQWHLDPKYVTWEALPGICWARMIIKFYVPGSVHRKYIPIQAISNKMQHYTVYFILKQLYIFRVVPPPIIRSAYNCIYSIWYLSHRYCYLPLSNSSTIAADSSNGVTNTRCCRYSCMRSWWWVEVPPETCRAVSRYK